MWNKSYVLPWREADKVQKWASVAADATAVLTLGRGDKFRKKKKF